MKQKNRFSAYRLTVLAILSALTVVFQLISSQLTIGTVSITLSLVPIVIGAVLLGPSAGALLGAVLGAVNFVASFSNPFLLLLFQSAPIVYLLLCFGKTIAAGAVSGWIARFFHKKNSFVGVCLSSLATPVVNTGLFFAAMLTVFRAPIVSYFGEAAAADIVVFVAVTLIGINFIVEFAINAVLCPAVHLIMTAVQKNRRNG